MASAIDWSTVPPEHPVCETLVEVPTIRVQPRGQGYPHRPPEFEGQEELVVQWFGDNQSNELAARNLQFAFPLASKHDIAWFFHPEWFRAVMIGPFKDWPNQEAMRAMVAVGRLKPDSLVLYALTAQIGMESPSGLGIVPAAKLVQITPLGDGNFGIIRPRPYANWDVSREEIEKLAATSKR